MNNILDVVTITWSEVELNALVLRKVDNNKMIVVFGEKIALVDEFNTVVTLLDIEDVFPI